MDNLFTLLLRKEVRLLVGLIREIDQSKVADDGHHNGDLIELLVDSSRKAWMATRVYQALHYEDPTPSVQIGKSVLDSRSISTDSDGLNG